MTQVENSRRLGRVGQRCIVHTAHSQVEYFVSGPGGSPTVVMLPALGRSVAEYAELCEFLRSNGFQIVAIQSRGVGGSMANGWPLARLDDLVEDVASALNDIQTLPNELHLLGRAIGNRIARGFASRYPARVASLILLGAGGRFKPKRSVIVRYLWSVITRSVRLREQILCAPGHRLPDHLAASIPWRAVLQQLPAVRRPRDPDWWLGGHRPMLVLQGECDQIAPPENAFELARVLPGLVRIELIHNAGHSMLTDQFDQVCQQMLDFISTLK